MASGGRMPAKGEGLAPKYFDDSGLEDHLMSLPPHLTLFSSDQWVSIPPVAEENGGVHYRRAAERPRSPAHAFAADHNSAEPVTSSPNQSAKPSPPSLTPIAPHHARSHEHTHERHAALHTSFESVTNGALLETYADEVISHSVLTGELKAALLRMTKERDQAREQVADLQRKLAHTRSGDAAQANGTLRSTEALAARLLEAESRYRNLMADVDALTQQLAREQAAIQRLGAERSAIEDTAMDAVRRAEALQLQLAQTQAQRDAAVRRADDEQLRAEENRSAAAAERTRLNNALQAALEEASQLRTRAAELREEARAQAQEQSNAVGLLRAQLSESERRLQQAEHDRLRLAGELDGEHARSSVSDHRSALDAETALSLRVDNEHLRNLMQGKERHIQELQASVQGLAKLNRELQALVDAQELALGSHTSGAVPRVVVHESEESYSHHTSHTSHTTTAAASDMASKRLQALLDEKTEALELARQQHAQELANLRRHHSHAVDDLRSTINSLESALANERQRYEQLASQAVGSSRLHVQVDSLQLSLSMAREEVASLTSAKDSLQALLDQERRSWHATQVRMEERSSMLAGKVEELQRKEVQQLASHLTEADDTLSTARAEIAHLQRAVEEQKAIASEARELLARQQTQRAELETKLLIQSGKYSSMEAEFLKLENALSTSRHEHQATLEQSRREKASSEALRSEQAALLEDYAKRLSQLASEAEDLRLSEKQARQVLQDGQETITLLKSEVARLSSEVASAREQRDNLSALLTTCRNERDQDLAHWQRLLNTRDILIESMRSQLSNQQEALAHAVDQSRAEDSARSFAVELESKMKDATVARLEEQVVLLTSQHQHDTAVLNTLRTAMAEKEAMVQSLSLMSPASPNVSVRAHNQSDAGLRSEYSKLSSSMQSILSDKERVIAQMEQHHAQVREGLSQRIGRLEELLKKTEAELAERDSTLALSVQERWTLLRQLQSESQRVAMLVNFFTDASLEAESVAALHGVST